MTHPDPLSRQPKLHAFRVETLDLDLLIHQRELLRVFRQAETLRQEALTQHEAGHGQLQRLEMAYLLDNAQLSMSTAASEADFTTELSHSVAAARQTVTDLRASVDTLLHWRERRRKMITAATVVSVLLCIALVIAGYQMYRQVILAQHYQQGIEALQAEEWEQATVELEQVWRMNHNYREVGKNLAEAHYQIGMTQFQAEEWDKAAYELEKVWRVDQNYREVRKNLVEAHYQIGTLYLGAGEQEKAITEFRWVRGLDPSYKDVEKKLQEARQGAAEFFDFDDVYASIPNRFYEGETEERKWYFADGEYHVLIKKANWATWKIYDRVYSDFSLEVDARFVDGPSVWSYGLIFRQEAGDNFYVFYVSSGGNYVLFKHMEDDRWVRLYGWNGSSHIETGYGINHLKVICQGPEISLYVNDHRLSTVTDSSLNSGALGVIAGTHEKPRVHIAFDNLKVQPLP